MDKFKELSFEEMQEVDGGGFSLCLSYCYLVHVTSGIMEIYTEAAADVWKSL
jgi:bacteriocin-like protein